MTELAHPGARPAHRPHDHADDHAAQDHAAHDHAHERPTGAGAKRSALATSAGARLLAIAPALALLWAGVWWALR